MFHSTEQNLQFHHISQFIYAMSLMHHRFLLHGKNISGTRALVGIQGVHRTEFRWQLPGRERRLDPKVRETRSARALFRYLSCFITVFVLFLKLFRLLSNPYHSFALAFSCNAEGPNLIIVSSKTCHGDMKFFFARFFSRSNRVIF